MRLNLNQKMIVYVLKICQMEIEKVINAESEVIIRAQIINVRRKKILKRKLKET